MPNPKGPSEFSCNRGPHFYLLLGMLWAALLLSGCSSTTLTQAPPPQPTERAVRTASVVTVPVVTVPAVTVPAQTNPRWVAEFAAYIQDEVKRAEIPGASLAVVNGDGLLLLEGYGLRDVEKKLPVDGDTLFHIGSTHKSMTALLVGTLVDEGTLGWDTPAVEIDPDFALSDEKATQTVTLRHLLSMTSGIPDTAEDDLPEEPTVADVFAVASEAELLGKPGEVYSYSNISASLAGYLAALAAGSDFDNVQAGYAHLLQERLLDPLGMGTATIYISEARRNPNRALAYDISSGAPEAVEEELSDSDALAPAGSLKASAREMAYYMQMLVKRGVAPNGKRIVAEQRLAEMWTPGLEDYGLAWDITQVDGLRLVSHTGAVDGFVSVIGLLPEEGVGFVLLVNEEENGGPLTDEAAGEFARLFAK